MFSHDGKLLANGFSGKIEIWDTQTWKRLSLLHNARLASPFAFSPDGKTITICSSRHEVQVWNVKSAKRMRALAGSRTHIAFSPDGSLMAGWSMKNEKAENGTKIWDARTGKRIQILNNQITDSDQCVFSPGNRTLIIASVDNFVKIYDVGSGKLISDKDAFGSVSPPIALSPDGKIFTTIEEGNRVDAEETGPEGGIRPAGDSGFSTSYSAKLWSARTGKLIRSLGYWETKATRTSIIGFTADSKKIIVNVGDKIAYGRGVHATFFDVTTGKELRTVDIENPVLLSPDCKILVSGKKDSLTVWAMP